MRHLKSLSAIACTLVLLAGCAQFNQTLKENEESAKLVVTFATMKYVEKAGDSIAQAARAVRVRTVTEQALALTENGNVLLSALEASVRVEVQKLQLSPSDAVLADGLVTLIAQELQKRFGSGMLSQDQLVETRAVLGWVVDATRYAAPV